VTFELSDFCVDFKDFNAESALSFASCVVRAIGPRDVCAKAALQPGDLLGRCAFENAKTVQSCILLKRRISFRHRWRGSGGGESDGPGARESGKRSLDGSELRDSEREDSGKQGLGDSGKSYF
jgi:hypothetical protein